MKQRSQRWDRWCNGAIALVSVAILVAGCGGESQDHPAVYQYDAKAESNDVESDRCAAVNEGCPCQTPGEVADCGKVTIKVDNYESCYDASRLCGENRTWGACVADQEIVQIVK